MINKQTEESIVNNVLKALADQGLLKKGVSSPLVSSETEAVRAGSSSGDKPYEMQPRETIGLETAHNMEAIKVMRESTPARILLGRCGTRPRTTAYLNFLADHASAMDAVFMDVSDEFLEQNNLFKVQTVVQDKDEYLMNPNLGKKLSEEAKQTVREKCEKGKQVQIIVSDGLSSTAIEANIADTLPALMQGLKAEGLSVGTPFFVKYGRVGVQDCMLELLDFEVIVNLIGERPGLITAESMSAYISYKPNENTVEADRTVISNIHKGGTPPPAEAGAHMATVIKQVIKHKVAGVQLSELLK